MSDPSVLVVIINRNHGNYLRECLDALRNQSYSEYRTIIIDNDSTDGSPEWIEKTYPEIHLCRFSKNHGFSFALNYAVSISKDPFILSLNPDVYIRRDFIFKLVIGINQNARYGIAAPKLLSADDPEYIDSTGLFVNRSRGTSDRGQGELDLGQYDGKLDVFGASGAAVLYRRAMLEDVAIDGEYFDENFFAYYEDADISWRAQLRGWSSIFVPTAIATHVRGSGDTLRKQRTLNVLGPRLALRNRYLTTIKNDTSTSFIADIPIIFATEFIRFFYIVIRFPTALLGFWDIMLLLPSTWQKRKKIQKSRTVDNNLIRKRFFL